MRTSERTLADLLELLLTALPKKKLADFAFAQAPEKRRLPQLTALRIEPSA